MHGRATDPRPEPVADREDGVPVDPPAGEGCAVVWDDALLDHDFGPYHPMAPVRLRLTHGLARSAGLLDRPGVRVLPPPVAEDATLRTVHEAAYVAAVRRASRPEGAAPADLDAYGLGGEDVPAVPGLHESAARIVGGAVAAVDAILDGTVRRAVHVAGGMHHAMPAAASGFCVYNDAAVAVRHALDRGEPRVLYVDVDVHHGDGVEHALRDEPRAVTLSVHETGEALFPGTGSVRDTGGPGAPGSAINVPLPPRTDADGWVRAIRATVPALARAVRPTLLVTQHGADTHARDPLADLSVTLEAQREVMLLLRSLADELCGGRWLALGGGGYAVIDVVPRSWAHLVAVATGDALDPDAPLPEDHLRRVEEARAEHGLHPRAGITTFGDGVPLTPRDWAAGFDPDDPLDRAVQAARQAVFPEWGLDPLLD